VTDDLAERQARAAAALARELVGCANCGGSGWFNARGLVPDPCRDCNGTGNKPVAPLPCTWGDDAWHRAVTRLAILHLDDFQRFLAEERAKTQAGEQP
jgi:hypothetical protein